MISQSTCNIYYIRFFECNQPTTTMQKLERWRRRTHSLALWNWVSRPIINNVSRESTKVAPRPPKLSTPFIECGCEKNSKLISCKIQIWSRRELKSQNVNEYSKIFTRENTISNSGLDYCIKKTRFKINTHWHILWLLYMCILDKS